jgi:hypothetical protein
MTKVISLPVTNWEQSFSTGEQDIAIHALERGNILWFPQLGFPMQLGEDQLLTPAIAGKGKNVSLDPKSGAVRGTSADEAEGKLLQGMIQRYATTSRALLGKLFPRYEAGLLQARTSFRPTEIAGRPTSWRQDDTRLHVDSFPSSPTHGTRILRIFTNINPHGKSRQWRVGESFEAVARRYLPSMPAPLWGVNHVLNALGLTKSLRTPYDHYMLHLHDRMKADVAYQAESAQSTHEFQPGCTWMVFTDQASHAAMTGQYALEQTFHLQLGNMLDPAQAPLRVLERLLSRELA